MEDQSHQIHSAFTNTSNIVSLEKVVVLRIGDSGEVLSLLLPGVKFWAFITAWNPLPDILTLPENLARNEALAQMLTEKGYRYHAGIGQSAAGDWQEDSFLIRNHIIIEFWLYLQKKTRMKIVLRIAIPVILLFTQVQSQHIDYVATSDIDKKLAFEVGNEPFCEDDGKSTEALNDADFSDNSEEHFQPQSCICLGEQLPMAVFINPPADVTVECPDKPDPSTLPVLQYTNNLDGQDCVIAGQVTATRTAILVNCGGVYTYSWQFTDQCGRTITHTQNVTILPPSQATLFNPPTDITVAYTDKPDPNVLPLIQYSNGMTGQDCEISGQILPILTGDLINCAGGVYTYQWQFTDNCDRTSIYVQNVTILPPMILDTSLVTIYDTLVIRDTIIQFITDTTYITLTKEVAVTDTLIINLNVINSSNQTVVNNILVYPNPASSHIYLDMGDPALLQNYDMQILNSLGQPVYFTTIDKKLYYIDLNGWSGKGTYFLKIKNPNGTTIQTKKIVLQ